jgi:hypothetical protein
VNDGDEIPTEDGERVGAAQHDLHVQSKARQLTRPTPQGWHCWAHSQKNFAQKSPVQVLAACGSCDPVSIRPVPPESDGVWKIACRSCSTV